MVARSPALRCLVPAIGLALVWSPRAYADDKQLCVSAYEETQSLRKEGQLRKARERVLTCVQESCPAVVRKDCAQWLPEIEASIPTIVFEVRGPSGGETSDVRVFFDGQLLAERLDGKAIAVEPGEHTFRYELIGASGAKPIEASQPGGVSSSPARSRFSIEASPPGGVSSSPATGRASIEERVVVREGEKNRKLTVSFAANGAGGKPADPAVAPADTAVDAEGGGGVPPLAWVLGGVGVVGIGAFATLGLDRPRREERPGRHVRPELHRGSGQLRPHQAHPRRRCARRRRRVPRRGHLSVRDGAAGFAAGGNGARAVRRRGGAARRPGHGAGLVLGRQSAFGSALGCGFASVSGASVEATAGSASARASGAPPVSGGAAGVPCRFRCRTAATIGVSASVAPMRRGCVTFVASHAAPRVPAVPAVPSTRIPRLDRDRKRREDGREITR